MFNRKVPSFQKASFSQFELFVIETLVSNLDPMHADKLQKQLPYLKLRKQINYKNDIGIELYPEHFNAIPSELLFDRRDDFKLASISFAVNGNNINVDIYLVLGKLFELRVAPSVDFTRISSADMVVRRISVDKNLGVL